MEKVPNTKWGSLYYKDISLVYDKNTNVVYYYDEKSNDKAISPFLSPNGKACVLSGNKIVEADTKTPVISTE